MYRLFLAIPVAILLLLLINTSAYALDESSDALQFIPPDASMVMAFDADEFGVYGNALMSEWRDADVAHFDDALISLSDVLAKEKMRPDVFAFFSRLHGVQAITINPSDQSKLIIFSTDSSRNLNILAGYSVGYLVERAMANQITTLNQAISDYYYRAVEDKESGEMTYPMTYPESLQVLVDEGYLEALPVNPYTGMARGILYNTEDASLGDIVYLPCRSYGGCCGGNCSEEEMQSDEFYSYRLISYHFGGIRTTRMWGASYERQDAAAAATSILNDDLSVMGFETESDGGWTYLYYANKDIAFAYGDNHLIFGNSTGQLKEATNRFKNQSGFTFSTPEDFNTEGAIYRDQADLSGLMAFMESGMCPRNSGNLPPEVGQIIEQMMSNVGLEALETQHTACWLRNGRIESVRRIELSGDARNSLIGSLMAAPPRELMTAEGGPMDIIGEVAWANPNDFAHAYIDFIFEFVFPMISRQTGIEGMNPNDMLSMAGLGNIQQMNFGDQAFILVTGSEDRGGGMYLPGITGVLKIDNTDLARSMIALVDTMTMMIPDMPFYAGDFGDENSMTWVLDYPELPITPTIAWTDGWVIKGLWREDVLAVRDALESGILFAPDGMPAANMRIHFNRQELLRGLADISYEIPETEVSMIMIGGIFELLAQLSNPDERLYVEVNNNGEYMETHCMLSIDLLENLLPIKAYLMRGIGGY